VAERTKKGKRGLCSPSTKGKKETKSYCKIKKRRKKAASEAEQGGVRRDGRLVQTYNRRIVLLDSERMVKKCST